MGLIQNSRSLSPVGRAIINTLPSRSRGDKTIIEAVAIVFKNIATKLVIRMKP